MKSSWKKQDQQHRKKEEKCRLDDSLQINKLFEKGKQINFGG